MRRALCLVVALSSTVATSVAARDLDSILPGLFGGNVEVSSGLGQQVIGASPSDLGTDLSQTISSSINAFRSQIPVPSASAGYTYEFDEELDLWLRTSESLGPLFTQRAQTLGAGKFSLSASYSYVHFDTFFKTPTQRVHSTFEVGQEILRQNPAGNQFPGIANDVIELDLNFDVDVHNLFLFASYGITDHWDAQIALPVVYIRFQGDAKASIVDVGGDSGRDGALSRLEFARNAETEASFRNGETLQEFFDEDSVGLGDIYLRTKYHFLSARNAYVDLAAVATLTVPTGGGDDFRGFKDPTFTPQLVISRNFAFVSPHLNAGYSLRSRRDGSQANWAVGADIRVASWLTLVPDVLGTHDTDTKSKIKSDIYQYSMGLKVNVWKQLVIGANFQFPLNRDGLRANVIYTGQVEYSF